LCAKALSVRARHTSTTGGKKARRSNIIIDLESRSPDATMRTHVKSLAAGTLTMGMLQLVVLAASIAAAHAAAAAPLNIAEATYLTDYPVRAARFACCQQRQTQRSASACPPPALSLPDHPAVTLPPLRPR
jgi:hypothetical protein